MISLFHRGCTYNNSNNNNNKNTKTGKIKYSQKHPKSINGQPSNYERVIARIVPFICIVKPNPLLKLVSISNVLHSTEHIHPMIKICQVPTSIPNKIYGLKFMISIMIQTHATKIGGTLLVKKKILCGVHLVQPQNCCPRIDAEQVKTGNAPVVVVNGNDSTIAPHC